MSVPGSAPVASCWILHSFYSPHSCVGFLFLPNTSSFLLPASSRPPSLILSSHSLIFFIFSSTSFLPSFLPSFPSSSNSISNAINSTQLTTNQRNSTQRDSSSQHYRTTQLHSIQHISTHHLNSATLNPTHHFNSTTQPISTQSTQPTPLSARVLLHLLPRRGLAGAACPQ